LLILPSYFLGLIVFGWGRQMLQVHSRIDGTLAYPGVVSEGSPYVGLMQDQTPTFFAFMRFMINQGDGSLALYGHVVDWINALSLAAIVVCFAAAILIVRRDARFSPVSVASLASLCIAGMLPLVRNIEVGNANIWVAAFVALHLLAVRISRDKTTDFLGGAALGVAFMIKPYLFLVLVFLFFSSLRKREFAVVLGVIAAGACGFGCSLLVPGIGLDTYRQFIFEVSRTVYFHGAYHEGLSDINLSLLKYVPTHMVGGVSALITGTFGVLAFIASKKGKCSETPWYFITLFPYPIMWEQHLMGIFPAFFFLFLEKEKLEQVVLCAMVATLMFFSCVIMTPLIPNILLFGLWLWNVWLSSSPQISREMIPLRKESGDRKNAIEG